MSEFKCVPVEPLATMMIAGSIRGRMFSKWSSEAAGEVYKAMIAAVPLSHTTPSDTEMLDWVTENRVIVDYYGNGYRVCFIDDGSFYPEVYPTIQEAIKAAMQADREGS